MANLPTTVDRPRTSVSSNDALVDLFMERSIDLLRLEAGTRDKVVSLLSEVEQELVAKLAKIDPTGVTAPTYQRQRLQKLLDDVRATIRSGYRDVSALMAREIREVADLEATWTGNALNAATHSTFFDAGLSHQQLTTLTTDVLINGAASSDWWSRQAAGMTNAFADEMRKGIVLGETNAELIARIRGTTTQPGLAALSRTSATRLVRASVQTAANVAREAMYQKNDDLIVGLQWHATLDTRTSLWCLTRDGHVYSNDAAHKPKDGGPPWLEGPGKIHWGCRSTSIPQLKSWRDMGIDIDEVPEATRASMDGQVAGKTTFETWLGKQSEGRQNTVLGATKASLWRDGKITFRDLLDQDGRPLTADQLRAKADRK